MQYGTLAAGPPLVRRRPTVQPSVDLHRLTREQAVQRLSRELHSARVRGLPVVLAITGLGFGNLEQRPVLRDHVERWLRGPEGRRFGVREVRRTARGGALEIRLR